MNLVDGKQADTRLLASPASSADSSGCSVDSITDTPPATLSGAQPEEEKAETTGVDAEESNNVADTQTNEKLEVENEGLDVAEAEAAATDEAAKKETGETETAAAEAAKKAKVEAAKTAAAEADAASAGAVSKAAAAEPEAAAEAVKKTDVEAAKKAEVEAAAAAEAAKKAAADAAKVAKQAAGKSETAVPLEQWTQDIAKFLLQNYFGDSLSEERNKVQRTAKVYHLFVFVFVFVCHLLA